MSFYLGPIDLEAHNEEARRVWEAYHSGNPVRAPVTLGVNPRIWLLNAALNTEAVSFEQYSEDPDLMARVQMISQHYTRHNLLSDAEMGPPKDGWGLGVDFQNYYEAAWFGARIEYRPGQVPDTSPMLGSDNKRMLFDRGIPDPFEAGCMAKAWRFYEHMREHLADYSYDGLPAVGVSMTGLGTDGPMTVAANLRGATELCLDFYEDPNYVRELLGYVTEATIHRIAAFRRALGHDPKPRSLGFADDSIELLSVAMYREFVLPCHRRLIEGLAGEGPHSIHLCGDVDRLIPTLRDELNIAAWDAGYPMDYAAVRAALGPEFEIHTGPTVGLLLHGAPHEVAAETRRILESGIAEGGRFILREANNLSPCTPVANVAAMYEAAGGYAHGVSGFGCVRS